ncbi:MAG: CAP domain-containing protein [bacterium]|nr:CAP domain-containing protein [bacterium]
MLLLLAALALLPVPCRAADWDDPQAYHQAQDYMLSVINKFRDKKGLQLVQLDSAASQVARDHAQDMFSADYFSHWDTSGVKPTRRWNLLGGYDSVSENIYFQQGNGGSVEKVCDAAMKTLMNSDGHRATIMDPAHTHVGLGFAVDSRARRFYVDQTFVTRAGGDYACPLEAHVGQTVQFSGRFDPQRYEFENVIMGYEELPQPRNKKWLNGSGSYKDADRLVAGYTDNARLSFNGMATYNNVTCEDGAFTCDARLDFKGKPGLYYLFLWLRDRQTGKSVVAATATVEARR